MKKIYLLLTLLLITATSFGQTIILLEEFSGAPQYTLPEMPEQIVSPTDYFTRTDGTNIGSPINFTDGETYFAAQDIDTSPMVSPATMLFNDIDISWFSDFRFGVGLAEHDATDGNEDWDSTDFVHFEYQIDNSGIWKNLVWIENDGSAFNSAPQRDTDFDGVGDGSVLINEFNEDFDFTFTETGSLIDIRVTFGGLDSADEDIAIDIIYLVDSYNLFPMATITSPTAFQVFPAGTTSVNIQYTTSNSPSSVDIDVNGVITTGIGSTGPFKINTVDGQIYNVEILVFMGGVEVTFEFISFSIDSPLDVNENKIEGFNFSPNPTSLGYINISSKSQAAMKVNVFDILGKKVISETISNNHLNVSSLNRGIYIMKVSQDNAFVTKKLVIN